MPPTMKGTPKPITPGSAQDWNNTPLDKFDKVCRLFRCLCRVARTHTNNPLAVCQSTDLSVGGARRHTWDIHLAGQNTSAVCVRHAGLGRVWRHKRSIPHQRPHPQPVGAPNVEDSSHTFTGALANAQAHAPWSIGLRARTWLHAVRVPRSCGGTIVS